MNFKFLFKSILIIIFIIILIYQVSILLMEYFAGKTVVNIVLGEIQVGSLPAVTICYPRAVSFMQAAKHNPELSQLYLEYINIIQDNLKNHTIKNSDINRLEWLY